MSFLNTKRGGLIYRGFSPGPGEVDSGQERILDWDLTINGTTVSPTCVYLASDINPATGAWPEHFGTAAGAMALQAGTAPTYEQPSPFGVGGADKSILYNAGGYHQAGNNTFADITTEDFVIEIVGCSTGSTSDVLGKLTGAPYYGLQVSYNSGGAGILMARIANNGVFLGCTAAPARYNWFHALFAFDRSGSAIGYVNTNAGSAVDISAFAATSVSSAIPLKIGQSYLGATVFSGNIQSFALWQGAAWLDTHLQATVAAERFQRWAGIYPQLAPAGDELATITRATSCYYQRKQGDGTERLFLAGAGLACIDDPEGDAGLRIEGAATNLHIRSEDFDNWTKDNVTVSSDSLVAPNGLLVADTIIESNDPGPGEVAHFPYRSGLTVAAAANVWSVWAKFKAGGRSWFKLQYGSASPEQYFNIETGALGTQNGANFLGSGIEPYGDGWYQCWMAFTGSGGSSSTYIVLADADNSPIYIGDGREAFYLWGSQLELGNYPSSYIPTTTAAVTRNALNINLHADIAAALSAAGQGTISCNVMLPDHNLTSQTCLTDLSDGTSANRISLSVPKHIETYAHGATAVSGAYNGGVYDPVNGRIYFMPLAQSNQTNWHYINLATGSVVAYAHGATAVANAYAGGVYDPINERIYFVPYNQANQTNWHYIDLATGNVVAYAHGATATTQAYNGGVYDPVNERIYFVPFHQAPQANWHYVDLATGNVVAYPRATAVDYAYIGGAYDPVNERIYFAPYSQSNQTNWHYINLATGSVVAYTHGATAVSGAYLGGVYDPVNERIYFVPFAQANQANWHYINLATGSVVAYAHGATAVSSAYMGSIYDPVNGRIYFAPYAQATQTNWHYIDLATGNVVAYAHGATAVANAYREGAYDPVNERIYFAPYSQFNQTNCHYISLTANYATATIRSGNTLVTIGVVNNIVDGSWHTVSMAWRNNRFSLLVDGVESTNTDCIVPTGLIQLLLGRSYTNSLYLNGYIRNLRIWSHAKH